jgi:hypothetical protein
MVDEAKIRNQMQRRNDQSSPTQKRDVSSDDDFDEDGDSDFYDDLGPVIKSEDEGNHKYRITRNSSNSF